LNGRGFLGQTGIIRFPRDAEANLPRRIPPYPAGVSAINQPLFALLKKSPQFGSLIRQAHPSGCPRQSFSASLQSRLLPQKPRLAVCPSPLFPFLPDIHESICISSPPIQRLMQERRFSCFFRENLKILYDKKFSKKNLTPIHPSVSIESIKFISPTLTPTLSL
jgi:hypothetical protein